LKAHPGHPRLSALTAAFVSGALDAAGAASGTFSIIFGEDAGRAAVDDPRVKVGAFTGSLRGGRALFDRAMSRPDPIPFFGELGSLNPVFVTAGAAAARMEEIVSGYVGSFTFGAGQLCTKPGLLFVPAEAYDEPTLADAVAAQPGAPLLNEHIEHGYHGVLDQLRSDPAIRTVVAGEGTEAPTPTLLMTTASELLGRRDELLVECFGPTSIVVTYRDDEELLAAAAVFDGQLTATVQGEDDDDVAPSLLDRLATRSGRVVWNGWPTGVSVTWAMQHGGPYPATTASATTSVGATAIGRFLRPVAYQSIPDALLPLALRDANPLGIPRRVDGHLEPTA
jgi:NADP-dependent aldehyde dehydrogenase